MACIATNIINNEPCAGIIQLEWYVTDMRYTGKAMEENKQTDPIIEVDSLRKTYRLYSKPRDRLLELLSGNRVKRHMDKHALDGISFSMQAGDRLGIMGENGSGKSTLLKILTGVLTPTAGTVEVRGKVAALLELGTGFHPDLTGVENVFQNGYIMGYSKEQMRERFPMIAEFSELGDAINYPVKTYSSGMLVRLAFACSVFVEPDILIVDEALAVGDAYFQTKCFFKIKELIDRGTTFVYVSHGQDAVRSLCNKGIVLEHGRIICTGEARESADFYNSYIHKKMVDSPLQIMAQSVNVDPTATSHATNDNNITDSSLYSFSEEFKKRVTSLRQSNGLASVTDVQLLNSDGEFAGHFFPGQDITIRISFEAFVPLTADFGVGIAITDENGLELLQCITTDYNVVIEDSRNHSQHVVEFSFNNVLAFGKYSLTVALAGLYPDPNLPENRLVNINYDRCYNSAVFFSQFDGKTLPRGKVMIPFAVSCKL